MTNPLLVWVCLHVYLQRGYFSKITKRNLQDSTDLVITKVTEKEKETHNSFKESYCLLCDPITENGQKEANKEKTKQNKSKNVLL